MGDARGEVVDYICNRFAEEDFLLNNILTRQESDGGPMMNVGPDQGKFLAVLMKLVKPKNVLEIGSYYGYSSVWIGRALKEINGSKLHCVEVSEKQVDIIKDHAYQAGLDNCIEVHHGAGIDVMQKFIKEGKQFDVVFVDADKANYSNYMDLATQLLPSGGLLLVDNAIWSGAVLDAETTDKQTKAIQAFNDKLAQSADYESVIVTIQDGLAFAVKK